jgi:hypothetical protein
VVDVTDVTRAVRTIERRMACYSFDDQPLTINRRKSNIEGAVALLS